DLKEKKLVEEEAENGKDAPANGNADNEENGDQENDVEEEEEDVGEEEDEEDDGEVFISQPTQPSPLEGIDATVAPPPASLLPPGGG
ncbi:uncharacterized, partial [Tachysurus ichikawai]